MNDQPASGILDPSTPILIVDDSIQFATILSKLLKGSFGYTDVTHTTSIEQGIAVLGQDPCPVRLLFVDYRFPNGETGLKLLEWLHREGRHRLLTAFLITSEPTLEIMSAVKKFEGYGVIAKPVDRQELKKQVEKAEAMRKADELEYF